MLASASTVYHLSAFTGAAVFGLLGDSAHAATGVLKYNKQRLGLLDWWVVPQFGFGGLLASIGVSLALRHAQPISSLLSIAYPSHCKSTPELLSSSSSSSSLSLSASIVKWLNGARAALRNANDNHDRDNLAIDASARSSANTDDSDVNVNEYAIKVNSGKMKILYVFALSIYLLSSALKRAGFSSSQISVVLALASASLSFYAHSTPSSLIYVSPSSSSSSSPPPATLPLPLPLPIISWQLVECSSLFVALLGCAWESSLCRLGAFKYCQPDAPLLVSHWIVHLWKAAAVSGIVMLTEMHPMTQQWRGVLARSVKNERTRKALPADI